VLVGKKNLEVRPIAVNKGEIVKRIMYTNPDAEFVFCAGDDKTDEDMFRAMCMLFPVGSSTATMNPPVSVTSAAGTHGSDVGPVTLKVKASGLFATTVGSSTKKTLAAWHVTSAHEIVNAMLQLVGSDTVFYPTPATAL
jgi:trehalose 6-phosphate synthase/phosphatase